MKCGIKTKFNPRRLTLVERTAKVHEKYCREHFKDWGDTLLSLLMLLREIDNQSRYVDHYKHICDEHKGSHDHAKHCRLEQETGAKLASLIRQYNENMNEFTLRLKGLLNRCFRAKKDEREGEWVAKDVIDAQQTGEVKPKA